MSGGSATSCRRPLGSNEAFCSACHDYGDLNVMCGLTLLTRHQVDEGLLKCALQEFQHMYPQLTSRIRRDASSLPHQTHSQLHFEQMECPILPMDNSFATRDMLHEKFSSEAGPLWRVQLITESNMDEANLGFGPELRAIFDNSIESSTQWRYFLRYMQGKVNNSDIADYDEDEEGFRSFLLVAFHPSITDPVGAFHLLRQFLMILDAILEQDGNTRAVPLESEELHPTIEGLIPQSESAGITHLFKDLLTIGKMMVIPRRSPFEDLARRDPRGQSNSSNSSSRTEILRGWLDEEQTAELLAMMEEDDATLMGVTLAAALVATSRVLQSEAQANGDNSAVVEYPPSATVTLRASHEANLRQYCSSAPKLGCLTTFYEADYSVPPVTDRTEFWRFAHEVSVRHNVAKGNKEPLKTLRLCSNPLVCRDLDKQSKVQNELGVATYGDLGNLFRRDNAAPAYQSMDTWNRPLSATQRNIRLEDVFHAVSSPHMGTPVTHTAHLLHGRLNYIMSFHTNYIEERHAFLIRDEAVNLLRLAAEKI